jgi:hypothetical protein
MKWALIILVPAILLIVLYLAGRKSVHTKLIIPADPEKIWAVLMDIPGYKEWNPVLIPIEGSFVEGARLKYEMIQPDGNRSELNAKVIKVIEQKLLNQFGGIPGILTFNHKYILDPVDAGTRVTIHEDYRGIGVIFWNAGWVEPAYERINIELKKQVTLLEIP